MVSRLVGSIARRVSRTRGILAAPGRPHVGVIDVVTQGNKIPCRVFYPTSGSEEGRDAPPLTSGGPFPLILYSHGLTGTGEEHALMFSYWAQQGFVVASIHHCDGSSCKVPRGDDEHLLYEHPDLTNYDVDFRPRQVEKREEEFYETLNFILNDKVFPENIRTIIDSSNVIAAGFSYGAATAALSVAKRRDAYKACVLLDGWFYIELGDGFDFPSEAHKSGLHVPALFVGSEGFANWKKGAEATTRLAEKNSHPAGSVSHVLEGTKHQNFTDVGFWIPTKVLQWVTMIGPADYDKKYMEILELTYRFIKIHTTDEKEASS